MPSLKFGIQWIALNDDPDGCESRNPEIVAEMISVCLLADLFKKDALEIAKKIVKIRNEAK